MDTNQKGDIGLAKVIADATGKGYLCFVPLSPHTAIDLILVSKEGGNRRIQVKYSSMVGGAINVRMQTTTCDGKRTYQNTTDKSLIDLFAVYCPELDKVLYLDTSKIDPSYKIFSIQTEKGNIRSHRVEDYLDLDIIFMRQ